MYDIDWHYFFVSCFERWISLWNWQVVVKVEMKEFRVSRAKVVDGLMASRNVSGRSMEQPKLAKQC